MISVRSVEGFLVCSHLHFTQSGAHTSILFWTLVSQPTTGHFRSTNRPSRTGSRLGLERENPLFGYRTERTAPFWVPPRRANVGRAQPLPSRKRRRILITASIE